MARNRPAPQKNAVIAALLNKPAVWQRGLWMVLFWLISGALGVVLAGIALLQFVSLLLTEQPQSWLADFGTRLNAYQYHLWQYLLAATEQKPEFSDAALPESVIPPAPPPEKLD